MESFAEILRIPLGYVMRFCYMLTQNYLFALLLFALVMQILLLPFGIKQQKNMVRQASLRPKEQAIRKKYAGRTDKATQQKMQEEIMALYQSENFNPMGGCLPLLIQMPILFALYQVIIRPLRYLCGLPSTVIEEIKERSIELGATIGERMPEIDVSNAIHQFGIDKFADIEGAEKLVENLVPKMTVFGGFDMAQTPALTSILILVPILTLVVSIVTQKLTRKFSYNPAQEQQQNNLSMKIMEYSMPFLSFWITFQVPAAIGIYWIFRNILQFVQTLVLYKAMPYPKFTEEDFKRAEKEVNATKKNYKKISNVSVPHSLHHIDDEEGTTIIVEAPKKQKKEAPKSFGLETASIKEDKKDENKKEE